ncbi:C2H2 and C2HC zinc fingers superfamily protein [Hibiscus syriacus]|uniref:C2H2 and C2HC zinc fingers superfamily protein n=1 Tax=Hibiscus syriacus TaxID=106335 RepID=A0A6A3BF72_HIBSY|nr:C2H2 and C2HC zinc fingers superfamily protein [Hibiscus syriacus]
MVEREDKQILPHEETIEILNLGSEEDKKEIKSGTIILAKGRQSLIELLREYKDVFAWSYEDMSEEVKKQFDAGFLKVAKYPEWVENGVPVPKKDGKVRMCVDYRDLNRANPKDNFPLPHIDTLVDNTDGTSYFRLMDGFQVMSFGLKNAGITYQRAMVTLFHEMMHKEIKVYVDDMIVKARTEEEHIKNLRKLFQRLNKCQLKLNPSKCTVGVTSRKLLGSVVSKKGIEVDPDKWKMNFDGASNALGYGIGAILVSPDGKHYPFTSQLNFDCTNNMAEYEACILGLRVAIELAGYVLDGDILYNKSHDHVLLQCVDTKEARTIIEEVHEGVCGTHANGHAMAKQIMRFGYYWSTLETDCINFSRKYHKCQIYGDKLYTPPHPLHIMIAPWLFSMWGMTSTRATLFSLAYWIEAVLPIEVEIPSLRVLSEVKLDETEWVQARWFKMKTRKGRLETREGLRLKTRKRQLENCVNSEFVHDGVGNLAVHGELHTLTHYHNPQDPLDRSYTQHKAYAMSGHKKLKSWDTRDCSTMWDNPREMFGFPHGNLPRFGEVIVTDERQFSCWFNCWNSRHERGCRKSGSHEVTGKREGEELGEFESSVLGLAVVRVKVATKAWWLAGSIEWGVNEPSRARVLLSSTRLKNSEMELDSIRKLASLKFSNSTGNPKLKLGCSTQQRLRLQEDHSESGTSIIEVDLPHEESLSVPYSAHSKSVPFKESETEVATTSVAVEIPIEKHPVQSTEVQVIDKYVIEEEPIKEAKHQHSTSGSSVVSIEKYEDDADDWLKEETSEAVRTSATTVPFDNDEDVSFSDLEDEDDVPISYKKVSSGSDS